MIDKDGNVILGNATIWPQSLDELYTLIETGRGNWVFTLPAGDGPLLTWSMAKRMAEYDDHGAGTLTLPAKDFGEITGLPFPAEGTLSISERDLFSLITVVVLKADYNPMCKPEGEKVGLWGPAVTDLLERLKGYIK